MRVFLTGATGYIGSAVARVLSRAGHTVLGLTRSAAKAEALAGPRLSAVVGDLAEPEGWRREAAGCDALVHLGLEPGPEAATKDRAALEALVEAARASGAARHVVYTSGVWVLGKRTRDPAAEDAVPDPVPIVAWRPGHERAALAASRDALVAAVVRPGCVYGERGGLYGMMIQSALERREIRVVGDGRNAWAAVYLDDLADLYRRLIERRASGVFHATDGAAEPLRDVAAALLEAAGGGAVVTRSLAEAALELGPFAEALALDQRVSSERARRELGWRPALASVAKNAPKLLEQWHEHAGPLSVA